MDSRPQFSVFVANKRVQLSPEFFVQLQNLNQLLHVGEVIRHIERADAIGLTVAKPEVSREGVAKFKNDVVSANAMHSRRSGVARRCSPWA